ncbi:putative SIGNAL PEPTIDE protein [Sinorhizobium sojae CCBAU 05684]|uniref:Putative SIGNAL PEPTIDE protein n=1 Tax=Sinorhizobium sojae CCBAU 05684 TaxID=716928 RepID=A0A249PID8_9HYPH|nr:putative SIGNAL PEPTIDE protein [Sinorhizobium sojae CCBAU 05684]
MGKSIAIFFASAAMIILAGSFMAPSTVASSSKGCTPAYGVDPCTTASVASSGN